MTTKKRIISLILSLMVIIPLAACGNKEEPKEQPDSAVALQDKAETTETENTQTENDSIVGTWVVEKTEVYDGPYKAMLEPSLNADYYVGAEYKFTADGICKSADGTMTTTYIILNDHQIHTKVVEGPRSENISEYELNGDELVLYCHYYSNDSNLPLSRTGAIYFKRK